jgi:hypothetical protein
MGKIRYKSLFFIVGHQIADAVAIDRSVANNNKTWKDMTMISSERSTSYCRLALSASSIASKDHLCKEGDNKKFFASILSASGNGKIYLVLKFEIP